jgi:hypothetical protein
MLYTCSSIGMKVDYFIFCKLYVVATICLSLACFYP